MNDDSLQRILQLLADGQFHSGQELGEILNLSRTAVWKQLQKLEGLGISLESIKGKGYRLPGGLDLLNAGYIQSQLSPDTLKLLRELDIHTVIDSTNNYVMQQAMNRESGYICLAEQQTAGKGRRGRHWISPFGKNIYLSLLWNFNGVAALEGLSLAVGVVIAEALGQLGIAGIQLKWPNDVLWRQRKLAGILLEMTGDPAGLCQVVVGIGINVSMPKSSALAIDQPWVDIETIQTESNLGQDVSRNDLVATLLSHLLPLLHHYADQKFIAYRERWESLNIFADQAVELHTAKSVVTGRMLGVDASGALRLYTEEGETLFHGGEVSLRGRHDLAN
jgi:BirA family transcriptional regulator, biotin operon repressor / biotin---[acetyl-CoA-carboxylase] ligase